MTKGTAGLYNKTKRKPGNTPSFLIVSWEVIEWDRFTLLTKELCKSKIEENFPYRDTVFPKQSRTEQRLLNKIKTFNIIGEGNFIFQDGRVRRGDPLGGYERHGDTHRLTLDFWSHVGISGKTFLLSSFFSNIRLHARK